MIYDITTYGAKPGREFLCTQAIQQAIDDCANAGGGVVLIPAGDYLTGSLVLKSNVHLTIENGATLYASHDPAHYTDLNGTINGARGFIFYASDAHDITIDGSGTVYGTGEADFGGWWGLDIKLEFRIGMLLFERCEHVVVDGVTFRNSDNWTLHFVQCENVWLRGIRILGNIYHLNSDGVDPDSCRNFFISDCLIRTGDDCICPKASVPGMPMENLVVTNCVLETPTTAIKLGTATSGDFRDMHFSNITIRNSCIGLGFYMKDGATIERVSFDNISIECSDDRADIKAIIPIYMDIEKRHADTPIGRIHDVTFSNIVIKSAYPSLIQGMPGGPIENVSLSNIIMRVPDVCKLANRVKQIGGGRSTPDDGRDTRFIRQNAYFAIAHTRGLTLSNFTVIREEKALQQEMTPVYLFDSPDAVIDRVRMR